MRHRGLWLALVFAWLAVCALPVPAQELPWQRGKTVAGGKPQELSAQEMLILLGIDESHWEQLYDGRPLGSEESETLTKLLFRMPRFDPPQWYRWAKTELNVDEVLKAPQEFRGQGMIVRGRARQVEALELLPELVPLYEFRKYYRVTVALEGSPHPVVIMTRAIPQLWKDTAELDEPVIVRGLFLKAGEPDGDKTPLYFVAPRLGWLPDKVNPELGVHETFVWLAQRGMDIALWDDVRANNGAAIGGTEAECFYHLLATLKAASPEDLAKVKAAPFDLPLMLTDPDPLLGRPYHCTGIARRVQKVTVSEAFRERLGIDHYYEIDMFLPLDNQAIRLAPAKGQEDVPTFTDGFPVTFNVTHLPEGVAEGDNVYYSLRLDGIFFKLWAYQSEYIKQFNKNLRQPSPLLMGTQVKLMPKDQAAAGEGWGSATLMMAVVGGVLVIWFAAWRTMRGDKRFERKVLRRYTGGPKPTIEPPDDKPAS